MISKDDITYLRELVIICGEVLGSIMILFWVLRVLWRAVSVLLPHLATAVVVGVFQFIAVIAGGIIAIGISIALFLFLFRWALGRFAELEEADAKILLELRKQSSSFVLATALVADCILAITDKSFGNPAVIVCATIVLILLFGIANHLLERFDGVFPKAVGWLLWLTGIVIVPVMVMLSKQWTLKQLTIEIMNLPPELLVVFAVSFLLAIVSPLALRPHRHN